MSTIEAIKPRTAEEIELDRCFERRDARFAAAHFLGRYTTREEQTGEVTMAALPEDPRRRIKYAHAFNVTANAPMARPLPEIADVSVVAFEAVRAELNEAASTVLAPVFDAMLQMGASFSEELR